MRSSLIVIASLLLPPAALAGCTPADAQTVAAAEKKANDAAFKADQAESVAVRSGNPGAQARATQARNDAKAAREEVAKLRCEAPPATPGTGPRLKPPPAY
jgi:hypothetical protein